MKSLLTDDLSHNLALRLICDRILIIKHRSIWKIFQETTNNILGILSSQCGTWNDFCKITYLTVGINSRKYFLFRYSIDLIDDQNHRHSDSLKLFCYMSLPCSDKGTWLHQPHNGIHFLQCSFCHLDHIFSQLVFCFMDTRSIKEYDLSLITGIDCLDTVSGCLWFLGCNGDLLTDQMVHQSRLSYIWTTDDRYKSGFKIFVHFVLFLINYYFSIYICNIISCLLSTVDQ